MKDALKSGLGFGVTSGIITTVGLIVGLHSGTNSRLAIIGGVLTIAIADAFSDSLGMHISKEFENKISKKAIWLATISTLISKFIIATTFILPTVFLSLHAAVIVSIVWGLSLLTIFSYIIAKDRKAEKPFYVVGEHLIIAVFVMLVTQMVGNLVKSLFI